MSIFETRAQACDPETTSLAAQDDPQATLPDLLGHVNEVMALPEFIDEFGDGLLEQVRRQNPPIYDPCLDEGSRFAQVG